MTPEERQLITGLFDRMRGFALTGKDGEAEALIKAQVGGLPDAPYMLVQSVLVQEHALQQADSRIKALEEQVSALQEAQQRAQTAPVGGSFLGGLFGGSRPAPEPERGASVPAIGARATPPANGSGQSAWGGGASQAPTQPSPWPQAAPQAAPAGGGFLQSAMATAAGVAGGMLAANAISSWLGGGHHATTGSTATAATATPAQQPQVADAQTAGPTEASHTAEAAQAHDLRHDASYQEDDGGWFGGGGGDFDV